MLHYFVPVWWKDGYESIDKKMKQHHFRIINVLLLQFLLEK